jgi:8-oxo-dGTP pyrophosphatase MutT (NUDIX family)
MNKKYYVLGFLFSNDCKMVALTTKKRPDWQAGYLNGIGGKIEDIDNSPHDAMIREFKEETGILIESWTDFAELSNKEWVVYCFVAFSNDINKVKTMTDEEVVTLSVDKLKYLNILDSLYFLIPLALSNSKIYSEINYE